MSFDFGVAPEAVVEAGGVFKNPELGDHSARLKSLIHFGIFREEYKGVKKKPCPQVLAVFELKDDTDFEEDGVTPLLLHKSFPLKKGEKAFMTKFLSALDPQSKAKGFDDLIGAACTVNVKGSKVLNDDGSPKYVNFGGISGLPAKFASMIDPLVGGGVGHVRFDDMTKEAVLEMNPILDVAFVLEKGEQYEGSVAQEIVQGIRKDNPEFAVYKPTKGTESKPTATKVETNLTEEEEF